MLQSWGCGCVTPALGLAQCFKCQVACFLGIVGTGFATRGLYHCCCYVSVEVVLLFALDPFIGAAGAGRSGVCSCLL